MGADRRVLCCGLIAAVCLGAGCGRGTQNVVPVDGRILFNGMPARASITTQAVNDKGQPEGRPSTADTRSDGAFTLDYTESQKGAVIGKHEVLITVYPLEREVGEFAFQERFKPVKVVRFNREVVKSGNNWNIVLTY